MTCPAMPCDGLIGIASTAEFVFVHHREREARGVILGLPPLFRQGTPLSENFALCVYLFHLFDPLRRGVGSGAGFPAFTALRMAISANISGPLPSTASSKCGRRRGAPVSPCLAPPNRSEIGEQARFSVRMVTNIPLIAPYDPRQNRPHRGEAWMMRFSNDRKQLKPQIQPTTQGCHPPRPTHASVIAVVLWQINLLRAGRQVAGEKSNQVTLVQVGAAGLMRMTTLRPNPAARKGTGHRALRAGPADA